MCVHDKSWRDSRGIQGGQFAKGWWGRAVEEVPLEPSHRLPESVCLLQGGAAHRSEVTSPNLAITTLPGLGSKIELPRVPFPAPGPNTRNANAQYRTTAGPADILVHRNPSPPRGAHLTCGHVSPQYNGGASGDMITAIHNHHRAEPPKGCATMTYASPPWCCRTMLELVFESRKSSPISSMSSSWMSFRPAIEARIDAGVRS